MFKSFHDTKHEHNHIVRKTVIRQFYGQASHNMFIPKYADYHYRYLIRIAVITFMETFFHISYE